VCGIISKIRCPEFLTWVHNYDIICLQETKTDDSDNIRIPGYDVHVFSREKLSRYRSGGIALLVKSDISPYVKIDTNSKSALIKFFRVSNLIYKNDNNEDLICGIVYIPPSSSRYAHKDPYFEVQNEIFRFCTDSKNIMLLGDFNSRCGNMLDHTQIDEFFSNLFELHNIQNEEFDIAAALDESNIQLNRNSVDHIINNYGRQFIELCKNNNFFIWNGRIGEECTRSKFTCKNTSVVDYFISTAQVFKHAVNFCVEEFCELYSDVHCPLYASIKTYHDINITANETTDKSPPNIKLWNRSEPNLFNENLDMTKVTSIEEALNEIEKNENASKSDIDKIVCDIASLFETTAKESFGTVSTTRQGTGRKTYNPWFNHACRQTRNKYHYTRRAYNRYKTPALKNELKIVSKEYKNTLRKAQHNYNLTKINTLKKLKTTDPRQYWRILNKDSSQRQEPSVKLNDFYNYFKALNEENVTHDNNENIQTNETDNGNANEEINNPITEEEILSAVKTLKNNKSPGIDNIINEHMKYTIQTMLPIYVKLFNIIFNTGTVPETWTDGLIKPIYKQKGDQKSPENYRPISLLSCLGKLFTSILNNRLYKYAESHNTIRDTQAGFRKQHSTVDNIFILKSLIDILQTHKKKFYCCFIDFKQAFDSVWRVGLWNKLRTENINGKCLHVIQNIYSNIKSRVITSEGTSDPFLSLVGVRQGENLSPFLFSIFLNDLEEFLKSNNVNGISHDAVVDGSRIFLKLCILLYADDTVIFSDDPNDLQKALNSFNEYCKTWKLHINVSKTKILIISKGNCKTDRIFNIGNDPLEQINEYKYLGLYFSKSGSFFKTKNYIAEQSNKAMFALLKKIKQLTLPFDMQIDLFEKTIKPILLYGSEIWGFGNFDMLERIQLKYYKYIFHLKKSTPSNMVYGELGITPLSIYIKNRVISYWSRLVENINDNTNSKLSARMFLLINDLYNRNVLKCQWIDNLKTLLCTLGYSGIWYSQSFISSKWLIKSTLQKLKDNFTQSWHAEIDRTSNSNIYKHIKTSFKRAYYIENLPNYYSKILVSFLTRNHRLPIETGRWQNIPAHERKCPYCNDVGDEYHYTLICPTFNEFRQKYLAKYFYRKPNMPKFIDLFQSQKVKELRKLSLFCSSIMNHFKGRQNNQ